MLLFSHAVQQVTVIDDGIPVLSSTTSVVITVEDVNDNAPEMLKKAYRFKIPETQPVQEPLTQENGTAAATAEMAEIDELLDKKPWICFGPNDIIGPALFRVRYLYVYKYNVYIVILCAWCYFYILFFAFIYIVI